MGSFAHAAGCARTGGQHEFGRGGPGVRPPIAGYLKYRADLPDRMAALLAADPDWALAHCLKGYLTMLQYKQPAWPAAAQCAARARAARRGRDPAGAGAYRGAGGLERGSTSTARSASGKTSWASIRTMCWRSGWRISTISGWAGRVRWRPRPGACCRTGRRRCPASARCLRCLCFALEECGQYAAAEPAGRRAIELDPGDMWAAHAVAHIMEMQGRRGEGIAWLSGLAPNWEGGNNLQHHLWWHCALFHLEHGDTARGAGRCTTAGSAT